MSVMENSANLLRFGFRRSLPLVLQTEVAECGLACLAMVAQYYGHGVGLSQLRQQYPIGQRGMNLQHMVDLAGQHQLSARALECSLDDVKCLACPCVLHWDMNHFVVLDTIAGDRVSINDPAKGRQVLTLAELGQHFTGIALELKPTERFTPEKAVPAFKLSQLWSKILGFKSSLVQLFLLSMMLQLMALASPYYMQLVIDEALINGDRSLLVVLAAGFLLMGLIRVLTNLLRSWLVVRLSNVMSLQIVTNLFHHLVRLPLAFFESRHLGDVISRFGSLQAIRERVTTGVVTAIVDGLMSVAIIGMMLFYNVSLSLVVLSIVFLYTVLRFAFYRSFQRRHEDLIETEATEQSHFIETMRGIQTIKLFAKESEREGIWQNRYADALNAGIALSRYEISFTTVNQLIFMIENIVIVYLAALLVLDNTFSVGMLIAFMAYKSQFTERTSELVEQLVQLKMLRLHLERVSDIALSEQEQHRTGQGHRNCKGKIELRGVSFQYGVNQPMVLDNINLVIRPGESLAIMGGSGSGKTTLMKIMTGLLRPTSGRILVDGIDLDELGLVPYRQQIAAVMQDDTLLSGSIADNITFFEPDPDSDNIRTCAQLACIHSEIEAMTMGYQTLVGDMGDTLSGGQIQRVLMARALYKAPAILFLDEATSHLDTSNEAAICEHIQSLFMTRITIAHRQETINRSKRCVRLHNGKLELVV